jgi:hypothetical protein
VKTEHDRRINNAMRKRFGDLVEVLAHRGGRLIAVSWVLSQQALHKLIQCRGNPIAERAQRWWPGGRMLT